MYRGAPGMSGLDGTRFLSHLSWSYDAKDAVQGLNARYAALTEKPEYGDTFVVASETFHASRLMLVTFNSEDEKIPARSTRRSQFAS